MPDLAFWKLFPKYRWLGIYLIIMNVVTFAAFGIDKRKAVEGRRRIPIVTLLMFSIMGGSIGGLLAMYLFRHKTKKSYFVIGMPMILVMQVVVGVMMVNW